MLHKDVARIHNQNEFVHDRYLDHLDHLMDKHGKLYKGLRDIAMAQKTLS